LASDVQHRRPVVGVLLAAGRGTRFGGDKLRAAIPHAALDVPAGTPLGVASARRLVEALPDSIAVIRTGDSALRAMFETTGIAIVECANADDGMGASLACGVRARADANGWIVALADMPWIASATIIAIATALHAGADIVAPRYRGMRGHPVGFSRRHGAALRGLTGDAGARAIVAAHASRMTLLDVDDPGTVRDVDTPDALGDRAVE
jgi:molybdenum cofactor cytidylyltransferase